MTNFVLKITLVISAFYLAACSTTKNTTTFIPVTAEPGRVVVYVYRPPVMSNAVYSPDLYINDKFERSIKNGNNIRLSLKPDEYKFEIKADKNYSDLTTLSLNLNADTICFIRVDTLLKIISSTNYEPYKRSFNLIKVEEQIAVKEIAECCATKNIKIADKSEVKSIEKEPDEGFSIDKTQNPFSH